MKVAYFSEKNTDEYEYGPLERYWQGKAEVLGEKPVPVPFCPPQIASAVRDRRLTASAMAWVM
jgi:hypothetical protein